MSELTIGPEGMPYLHWLRGRAAIANWELDTDGRTLKDEDGPIAECERSEDARFILAVRDLVAGHEGDNDYGVVVQAEPPSPSVWCRDEVADGTEAQRQLRDGKEHPIIKLHVTHPRSVYNEDFILVSRNDVGDLSAPMN
ncbi:hypothetical protein [Algiphilus sp.]|uniref:hypothetical protein n=1 Tax=Algiphilus sp. TaxID=1872431 RepID=UPI003BAD3EF6